MFVLMARVTRDEVLHVEMTAKSSALEYNLSPIAVNKTCAANLQNRVNSFVKPFEILPFEPLVKGAEGL